jgi:uncharacterized membrane protein YgcG
MKCIRCNHDSKYKERTNKTCPKCKGVFAFEPQLKDPVTDMLFKNAIDAVSSNGKIKWGVEHLYYEVCRRKRGKAAGWVAILIPSAIALGLFAAAVTGKGSSALFFPGVFAAVVALAIASTRFHGAYAVMDRNIFEGLWDRWITTHGTPKGLIERQETRTAGTRFAQPKTPVSLGSMSAAPPRAFGRRTTETLKSPRVLEADIGDYSFDRAVICDRARTVDLLVANNFHFENNCAILSIDGYPEGPFETIRTMLKRNPRLHVFTLHDATPEGCGLAHKIAYDPKWFNGRILVIDLGLRPRHAKRFHGVLIKPWSAAAAITAGVDAKESIWLSKHALELAAVRPEDVLKRLFHGIQAHDNDDVSGGGTSNCGSFDSGGGSEGSSHGASDSFG